MKKIGIILMVIPTIVFIFWALPKILVFEYKTLKEMISKKEWKWLIGIVLIQMFWIGFVIIYL